MHEFNADANKVDIHSNNTLKQLLFKIYTKEKSMHFCVQLVARGQAIELRIRYPDFQSMLSARAVH